jgi:hypothetical protein
LSTSSMYRYSAAPQDMYTFLRPQPSWYTPRVVEYARRRLHGGEAGGQCHTAARVRRPRAERHFEKSNMRLRTRHDCKAPKPKATARLRFAPHKQTLCTPSRPTALAIQSSPSPQSCA